MANQFQEMMQTLGIIREVEELYSARNEEVGNVFNIQRSRAMPWILREKFGNVEDHLYARQVSWRSLQRLPHSQERILLYGEALSMMDYSQYARTSNELHKAMAAVVKLESLSLLYRQMTLLFQHC